MQPDQSVTHTVSVSVSVCMRVFFKHELRVWLWHMSFIQPITEGMVDDVMGMNCVFLPQTDTHMHLYMANRAQNQKKKEKKRGNKACVVMLSLRIDGNGVGGRRWLRLWNSQWGCLSLKRPAIRKIVQSCAGSSQASRPSQEEDRMSNLWLITC